MQLCDEFKIRIFAFIRDDRLHHLHADRLQIRAGIAKLFSTTHWIKVSPSPALCHQFRFAL